MELPKVVTICGARYVRDGVGTEIEMSYSVAELSKMSGFPASTLYDNIRRGELKAVMPNGTTKGMRVLGSEFQRFLEAKTV